MPHNNYRPWNYFLIAIGSSWLFWIPAAFVREDLMNSPWVILLYLGGLGPVLGGILLSHWKAEPAARREYWARVFDFKRIGGLWYLVIFFFYPLLTILTIYLVNGQLQLDQAFQEVIVRPLNLVPFLLFLYLFGPFPEELGWRGYALDALQSRFDPALSSLILGLVWAIWHLPLFLMEGTYQHQLGIWSGEFWIFMLAAVLVSFFFTWIYNQNRRSILSASLFHFSVNLTGNIFFETTPVRLIRVLILLALVVAVVLGTRSRKFLGWRTEEVEYT